MKLKSLQHKYAFVFEKWRYDASLRKVILRKEASDRKLKDLISSVNVTYRDVQTIYEQIRQIQTPDADVRRQIDACTSLSAYIVKRAENQLLGGFAEGDEEPWPDVGSWFGYESITSRSNSQRSKSSSGQSCSQSRLEAEAEAAASQNILAVVEEQEKETAELQKLECENVERQLAKEEQRRKIKSLEEVKKLDGAKARIKVYDEGESISKSLSSLHSIKAESEIQAIPVVAPIPFQALSINYEYIYKNYEFV